MEINELIKKAHKIKIWSIVSLVLFFTLFLTIVSIVISIVNCIIILSTEWEDEKINDDKLLWGLLGLFLLGPIATIIFSSSTENKLKLKIKKVSMDMDKENQNQLIEEKK